MDQTQVVIPSKHLTCQCVGCKAHNSPYKVEYLYGDLILMTAVCANCHIGYWIRWDLLKVQLQQDEKEVAEIQSAMKLLEGAA